MTVAALARRPGGLLAVGVGAAGVVAEVAAGAVGEGALSAAAAATLPLLAFLAAALWLAALADEAGIAQALAAAMARRSRDSGLRLYALTCGLCAALTLTISLDGAIVLLVPLVLSLARGASALRRPLLLGSVAVANAASLAVPQGNPANLVVMQRLGLGPGVFIVHLALPALAATLVCALVPALLSRRTLRGSVPHVPAVAGTPSLRGPALAALGSAAVAGVVGPWLGIAPWLGLAAIAGATWTVLRARRLPAPAVPVPWRVGAQVAVLVLLMAALPGLPALGRGGSLLGLLAVAGSATVIAGLVNNLPAGVALAGLLGAPGPAAYGALTGLSVGALATPHGSVATMIAFDRAGAPTRALRTILPAALLATGLATVTLWSLG